MTATDPILPKLHRTALEKPGAVQHTGFGLAAPLRPGMTTVLCNPNPETPH